jgi:hypothetical protein
MAIFKSTILSAIRGSINGTVFSQNKSGPYTRNRSLVVNPNSPSQQFARGNLAAAAQAWKALTEPQRETWRSYAAATPVTNRLGNTIYLSGSNMFVKTNAFRGILSLTMTPTAPVLPGLAEAPIWPAANYPTLTDSGSTPPDTIKDYSFTAGVGSVSALAHYAYWISRPLSAGVSFYKGPWNYAGKNIGTVRAADKTSPTPLTLLQYYAVKVRVIDEHGRVSKEVTTAPVEVQSFP